MVHLRIVVPSHQSEHALDLLNTAPSVCNVIYLRGVATIPAAANIGVAAALGDWHEWLGAMEQLSLNLSATLLAGVGTLFVQRRIYLRRRAARLHDQARVAAGLPLGRSRRLGSAPYKTPGGA